MRAAVYEKYGPPEVVHLADVDTPTPSDNEVLVKVRATTVTRGDSRMRSFSVPRAGWLFARLYLGITGPRRKILGMELAGDIESVGKKVTRFKVGDAVVASTFGASFGGHAECKCLTEKGILAVKPQGLSYEEAAALPGGSVTALRFLRKANVQPGQDVLIYGASGAVGTSAVQLAKYFGAKVTGVCSTTNLEMVRSLGADEVVDYTQNDFTDNGETYDLVFDAVAKLSARRAKGSLKKGGTYLNVHGSSGSGGEKVEDLLFVNKVAEQGKLKPTIDRRYGLEDIVEAHEYVDLGHKKGNVVISIC